MVLQNASGIAINTPASGNDGTSLSRCAQQYIDTDAIGGYDGDGNGNGIGGHSITGVLSSPCSSSSIHSSATDCNRNRIVGKVDEAKYHHCESSKLMNHGSNSTNNYHNNNKSTGGGKRQHPSLSGKGVCASLFSSGRSSQQQNDVASSHRSKAGCRMSMYRHRAYVRIMVFVTGLMILPPTVPHSESYRAAIDVVVRIPGIGAFVLFSE
uniref:Uncharacterized protein n=1 Tax=Anopheles culicifacies TaxID=139723 RepID=A0A182LRM2_9DIPT